MKAYQLDVQQIENSYNTNIKNGLTYNILSDKSSKEKSLVQLLFGALKECKLKASYVHIVALTCFSISVIFSILDQNWSLLVYTFASLFLFFLLFFIESGALFYLKKKYFKHIEVLDEKVTVLRNGSSYTIAVSQLQIGDVVELQEGTVLRGDARIVESNRLFADETIVFGKTIPTEKTSVAIKEENILPENQKNMLWKGSFVVSGSGTAVIIALDEDCYIYKTGGREKRGQRSYVYNQKNNIGKILLLVSFIICVALFILAAIIGGRWVETIAVFASFIGLISLEPVSCITEWNYFYSAQKLYSQGALVRNIEVFDRINKEKDVYFEANALINGQLKHTDYILFDGDEKTARSYFALASKEIPEIQDDFEIQEVEKMMPVFRNETDGAGNTFCLLTDMGESRLVATGYWRKMLPYIDSLGDELYKMVEEMEIHGKMVYLLATKKMELFAGSLSVEAKTKGLKALALMVFDITVCDEIYNMIYRLKRSGIRVHLYNAYSEQFGKNLCGIYDMNDYSLSMPSKISCSVPASGSNVVYDDASMVEKEEASLILNRATLPQKIVYAVKCMFCGINRSLNFIGLVSVLLLISVFVLILKGETVHSLLFPLLLIQPILITLCYFLTETVRNCNQSKRSLVMGALFGVPTLIGALVGCDMPLIIPGLSAVLYAVVLWIGSLKHRGLRISDLVIIFIGLILAIFPWLFLGGNWLVAVLFAIFPAAAALVLDLIY